MTTTDDTDKPTEGNKPNIISFQAFKEAKVAKEEDKTKQKPFPQNTDIPKSRRYLIDLKDTTIEIEGFVGLTGSFLAIGDTEGRIKFGVAAGEWKVVTDITDKILPV